MADRPIVLVVSKQRCYIQNQSVRSAGKHTCLYMRYDAEVLIVQGCATRVLLGQHGSANCTLP